VFIFGFNMGVTGAAVATVISQAVSFLLLLFGTTRGENLRLSVRRARPHRGDLPELFRGGFPSLCRQGLSSVSTISLNWVAGTFGGDPAIAAMGIAARIMHMAFAAILGFGQGFQPVCGFNYGAGLYGRVKEAFWFCVKLGTALLLVASVAGFIFAPELVSLFSTDDKVIEIGALALRLQCVSFPLMAWTVMCTMLTQTMGLVVPASLLSLARQGLFFIPVVIGVPYFIAWALPAVSPILGVQMAQPMADIGTAAVSVPVCVTVMRRHLRKDAKNS
jgi:Na+-driven multidrug efflux pump